MIISRYSAAAAVIWSRIEDLESRKGLTRNTIREAIETVRLRTAHRALQQPSNLGWIKADKHKSRSYRQACTLLAQAMSELADGVAGGEYAASVEHSSLQDAHDWFTQLAAATEWQGKKLAAYT